MERQPYNNPWADKLLQVSMPDSGESWMHMEKILDQKMPHGFFGDRRRWLLLILLLLLLIGVCNCPGHGRLFRGAPTPAVFSPAAPAPHPAAPALRPAAPALRPAAPGVNPGSPGLNPTIPAHSPATPAMVAPAGNPNTPAGNLNTPAADPNTPTTDPSTYAAHPNLRVMRGSSRARSWSGITAHHQTGGHRASGHQAGGRHNVSRHTTGDPDAFADSTETAGQPTIATSQRTTTTGQPTTKTGQPAIGRTDTTATTIKQGQKPGAPPAAKPVARKDSSQKKKTPPQDDDQKEKDHGWVIGVGLNQFFPIGDQHGSTYNSDGLTGTLSDYLPVPMIRYYLNHKTYLQVEAQLNTPQPTAKNLVISSPLPDTSSAGNITTKIESSATIQQLFYFNVPLSLHYNLWNNLDIGTGLQWSHLTNAIGEFDSTITQSNLSGGTNVTNAKDTKSFRGDTLYRSIKTNEFRFLADVNYTYKHFVLGLRYNQALSRFVNIQLPTGGTTQARNSSLQLYLRYILLDTRRSRALSPK